jgi:uncharacterized membrane protein
LASGRRILRWIVAALFLLDGVLHVALAPFFVRIVPPWVPEPTAVVWATGVAAFAGGAGLLSPRLRRAAGVGLALYCAGVYPANLHHAAADIGGWGWGYHGPRLLLQPVIAWACLWCAEVIDWPFAGRREAARR